MTFFFWSADTLLRTRALSAEIKAAYDKECVLSTKNISFTLRVRRKVLCAFYIVCFMSKYSPKNERPTIHVESRAKSSLHLLYNMLYVEILAKKWSV